MLDQFALNVYGPDPWVVDDIYILAFGSRMKSFGIRVFYS